MAKINYQKLKERECEYCKVYYKPTGPAQRACDSCRGHLQSVTTQCYHDIARYNKWGTYENIGQGNSQGRGKLHHSYKNGIGLFQKLRGIIRSDRRYCEECGRDLKYVGRHQWCVHHVDFDRYNNEEDNFKLLCKSCHNKVHNHVTNITGNLKSVETIPNRSTLK